MRSGSQRDGVHVEKGVLDKAESRVDGYERAKLEGVAVGPGRQCRLHGKASFGSRTPTLFS